MSDGKTSEENKAQQRALEAIAVVARESLAARALKEHRAAAEMSHTARLALAKLISGAVVQGTGKAEIGIEDLEAVKEALRIIQKAGRLAFLRAHGNEEAYDAIGKKIVERPKPRARRCK